MASSFYAVPYTDRPLGKDTRFCRGATPEFKKHVYVAVRSGRLELAGYRWAMYLYGSEQGLNNTKVSSQLFNDFLVKNPTRAEGFRAAMAQEGYPATETRDVHYNVYIPKSLFSDDLVGFPINQQQAREYLSQHPIPRWINRFHHAYTGWDLGPVTYGGSPKKSEVAAEVSDDEDDYYPRDEPTLAPRAVSGPAATSYTPRKPLRAQASRNVSITNPRRHSADVTGVSKFVLDGNRDGTNNHPIMVSEDGKSEGGK